MTFNLEAAIRATADWFAGWRGQCRRTREMAGLDTAEFFAIAHDLRLSSAELVILARSGRDRRANLGGLLNALGVNGKATLPAEPAVMRDMERVCALCPATARCRRDLRKGISARTFRKYCTNRATIDALQGDMVLRKVAT